MPEEDEWFYGADLRFEGRQVLTRGDALRADQLTLEAEAAVRVRRIEADFQVFEQEKQVRCAASFFWCLRHRRGTPSPRRRTPPPRPLTFLRSAGDDRRGARRLRGEAAEARRRGE